ncbi:c-type cytochrome [Undibacterium sp.]|jgi:cytochrome c551/c552|uniref:c-type cytochrome n=1 Tax=Undibacterium sp. TaxID=1914977 RepID=UPI002B6C89DC|nr:c-type cytochrome [Undibacterium sp.]HTD04090.1 c-type cytochrome [Undibacterium sp.]
MSMFPDFFRFSRLRPLLRPLCAALLGLLLCCLSLAQIWAAETYPGVGRAATPKEIAAWDIDVRPDFKGLPAGSGSVAKGTLVWEGKCAMCHGSFGESNQVFTPIIGGTTKQDMLTGHVASLTGNTQPQRTTMMKLSQVSTLWDYINRAMPWNAPKTLTTEEVYAVTAYILNLAEVVPDDYVLSDKNIAEVQKRLPNRNGLQTNHGMWDVKGKPDVNNTACMKDCAATVGISSRLPDYARNAHGDIAEQNRIIGPVRGANTLVAAPTEPLKGKTGMQIQIASGKAEAVPAKAPAASLAAVADGSALAKKYACMACHAVSNKVVGPAFRDVQKKYPNAADTENMLSAKIKSGGQGAWGSVPMPANQQVSDADIRTIVKWIMAGAK